MRADVLELAHHPFAAWYLALPGELGDRTEQQLAAALDTGERWRWQTAPPGQQRDEMLVGRALLRVCLGTVIDTEPADVPLTTAPSGKPVLAGRPDPQVHASVSHSGGHVVAALSLDGPIGADVEVIGPHPERVAARFFDIDERALLAGLPDDQRDAAFYRIWTVKEACTKALGTGFGMPFRSVPVSLAQQGAACGLRWRVLDLGSELAACVAVAGHGPPLDEGPVQRLAVDALAAQVHAR